MGGSAALAALAFAILQPYYVHAATVSIEDFGAVPSVDTYEQALANGVAFAKAIETVNSSSSGGSVLIPEDRVYSFLPSVPCFEKVTNVLLQV